MFRTTSMSNYAYLVFDTQKIPTERFHQNLLLVFAMYENVSLFLSLCPTPYNLNITAVLEFYSYFDIIVFCEQGLLMSRL